MYYFYQIGFSIFLLQGIALPFLLILFYILRQSQKQLGLKSFYYANVFKHNDPEVQDTGIVLKDKTASNKISELILINSPNLIGLKCANCGAGVLLRETGTFCPHCETRGDLPEDFAAAISLKSENKMLVKRAVRYWRAANILMTPWSIVLFVLLAIIEWFFLYPIAANGRMYAGSINNVAVSLGLLGDVAFYGLPTLGIIAWGMLFLSLAVEGGDLRQKLLVVPVLDKGVRNRETANCELCGGAIEFDQEDFACICNCCNVVNFRVRFTRLKRASAIEQNAQINFALFGAMGIIEYYVELVYGWIFGLVIMPVLGILYLLLLIYAVVNNSSVLLAVVSVAGVIFFVWLVLKYRK